MKKLAISLLALVAAPAAAVAGDVSYNVGITSDYTFRGVSQADEGVAVQAGVDATAGLWYFGGWASNVDKDFLGSNLEYDLYAGIKPVLGPVTFDLGVISYNYQNVNDNLDAGTTEFKAGASFVPAFDWNLGATYYTNTGDNGTDYFEFGAAGPLGKAALGPFALGASVTYGTYKDGYDNYKVALNGTTKSGIVVEAAYVGTDNEGENIYGKLAGDRGVLTIKKNF